MISRVRLALTLLRGAVSVSILVVLFARTPLDAVLARAGGGALLPLALALVLVLVMYLLVSLRWRILAAALGLALPFSFALRAVFLGVLGGQLLPATVGGDLVRGWAAARHAGSVPRAAASVVADRLVALFGACLLLALAAAALGGIGVPYSGFLAPAAVVVSGGLLLGFLLLCEATPPKAAVAAASLVALAIHALGVLVAALGAAAYGIDSSLAVWFSIIPVSLIATAVPVSINGWGVREAVIVALAGAHGIGAADALVVSLTLGLLNVVASLPGAYLLLAGDVK